MPKTKRYYNVLFSYWWWSCCRLPQSQNLLTSAQQTRQWTLTMSQTTRRWCKRSMTLPVTRMAIKSLVDMKLTRYSIVFTIAQTSSDTIFNKPPSSQSADLVMCLAQWCIKLMKLYKNDDHNDAHLMYVYYTIRCYYYTYSSHDGWLGLYIGMLCCKFIPKYSN